MSEERTSSPCEKSSLFQAQNTQFQINPQLAKKCHESLTDAIVVHGTCSGKMIIGRGHDATVKIGKTNKCVSRHHVSIEYKSPLNRFELTVHSPNGAMIDRIVFEQGEHVPIMEGTCIEIVGTKLIFQGPQTIIPTPLSPKKEEGNIPKLVKSKNHIALSLQDEVIQVLGKLLQLLLLLLLLLTIIIYIVSTRKSTMTCKDICNKLPDQTMIDIRTLLSESPVIGCIKRLGKTADGSAKEDLYYYKAELDSNLERRKRYSDVG
ncbi:hypothetical protein INT48_004737 [Thamnidium elegans]|uniref:FHA domain-containing protein n=1 Tax=Thamnidium elegans TaxID=101142 RepID=A0A8H7SS36_9FUNG|nr:hypothetical protein INT48_004737 [Thamnidium elegans]